MGRLKYIKINCPLPNEFHQHKNVSTVERRNLNALGFQMIDNGLVVKPFRFQTAPKSERFSLDFGTFQKPNFCMTPF